jgi:hypothetical protein
MTNKFISNLCNPFNRNLWLSIVLAVPSVIVLYLLTNISYFTVMNKAVLLSSNAVAVVRSENRRCLINYQCIDMG